MYTKYLWSQLRHKWFVFLECCLLGIPWLGLVHDWSKFRMREFKPYARKFYGTRSDSVYIDSEDVPSWVKWEGVEYKTYDQVEEDFEVAWNEHQKVNKHHWQRWLLTNDSDEPQTVALKMPWRYAREMLADWKGAGRAYGQPYTRAWYLRNKDRIILHELTRAFVEEQLEIGE